MTRIGSEFSVTRESGRFLEAIRAAEQLQCNEGFMK